VGGRAAPQVADLFIGQFDDVKVVEDDGRPGQVFEDGTPVGGAHVTGHRLHTRPGQPQPPPELAQRIPAAPLGHPEDAAGVQIDDQREELRLPAQMDFINGQPPDLPQRDARIAPPQVRLDDLLDRVPPQMCERRHLRERHETAQLTGELREPVRVVRVGRGKKGATSKPCPHARHWQRGTSATSTTSFKPMGTVRMRRQRLPRRIAGPAPHFGQTSFSSFTAR
jgi:hypothetical protein